jgi:OTU domain-containing protein 5
MVRIKCMDYILKEEEYFKGFIEGGHIQAYVNRKKLNGIWGDDVEIQAMSEIYDRAIEIYAYDTKPMKTFHEAGEEDTAIPFRLSYHGGSHYNSIVPTNWTPNQCLV